MLIWKIGIIEGRFFSSLHKSEIMNALSLKPSLATGASAWGPGRNIDRVFCWLCACPRPLTPIPPDTWRRTSWPWVFNVQYKYTYIVTHIAETSVIDRRREGGRACCTVTIHCITRVVTTEFTGVSISIYALLPTRVPSPVVEVVKQSLSLSGVKREVIVHYLLSLSTPEFVPFALSTSSELRELSLSKTCTIVRTLSLQIDALKGIEFSVHSFCFQLSLLNIQTISFWYAKRLSMSEK